MTPRWRPRRFSRRHSPRSRLECQVPGTTTVVPAGGESFDHCPRFLPGMLKAHRTIAQIARIFGVRPKSVAGKNRPWPARQTSSPSAANRSATKWTLEQDEFYKQVVIESGVGLSQEKSASSIEDPVESGPFYQGLEGSGPGFGALCYQISVFVACPVSMVKYKRSTAERWISDDRGFVVD